MTRNATFFQMQATPFSEIIVYPIKGKVNFSLRNLPFIIMLSCCKQLITILVSFHTDMHP